MRNIISILFIGVLCLFVLPSDARLSYRGRCAKKGTGVVKAIDAFCAKPNMVTPSIWASHGSHGRNNGYKSWVGIKATCVPAQWLPQQYCRSQLFKMCADGDKLGRSQRSFGNGGCQAFQIKSGKA